MPPTRYPGSKFYENENKNVTETRLSVDKLFRNQGMKELVKPDIQCSLDDDKVEEMRQEYRNKPEFFRSKNKLIICDLNNTWYLVDGQHRYEMLRREFSVNNDMKEEVMVIWYKFSEEEFVNELFKSINKDSIKNKNYIDVENFVMIRINEFMNLLRNYHSDTFNKTKKDKSPRKSVEELREQLKGGGFFDNPYLKQLTSNELYEYFMTRNDEFYQQAKYDADLLYNSSLFYDKERGALENKIVFTTKHNNFVEWICQNQEGDNLSCIHYYRKEKKKIVNSLRNSVWRKYHEENETATCPISWCNKPISRTKEPGSHCGHIISEKNGGDTHIDNLRPICAKCNCEMGATNWSDYDNSSLCQSS